MTAVAALSEPVTGSTIVGMPREPGAEDIEDGQEAHLPVERDGSNGGKESRDGNTADRGQGQGQKRHMGGSVGAVGKAVGGQMIGQEVNAAGMTDDDDEAYDLETHQKYEQVKRSELHLVDLQRMSVQEWH